MLNWQRRAATLPELRKLDARLFTIDDSGTNTLRDPIPGNRPYDASHWHWRAVSQRGKTRAKRSGISGIATLITICLLRPTDFGAADKPVVLEPGRRLCPRGYQAWLERHTDPSFWSIPWIAHNRSAI